MEHHWEELAKEQVLVERKRLEIRRRVCPEIADHEDPFLYVVDPVVRTDHDRVWAFGWKQMCRESRAL